MPEPTSIQAPEAPSEGSDSLMGDLMAQLNPTTPPAAPAAEPASPAAPAPKPEPPKEPAKPAAAKPAEPAKPAPKATPPPKQDKEIDPDDPKVPAADLRKAYKALKSTVNQSVAQKQADIDRLTSRISEFEKRKYWSEEDIAAHDKATKRLNELESRLYSQDYRQSPEFKEKFIATFERQYNRSLETVKGMTVKYTENDETKERPATKADFDRVINAPLSERYRLAKGLFGEDAHVVTKFADSLNDLDEQANQAVTEKQKSFEQEQSTKAQQTTKQAQDFENFKTQSSTAFAETYPDIFKDDTDPEGKSALERGMKFVSDSVSKRDMPFSEQAARAGVIQNMAAAFPRLVYSNAKMQKQVEELTAELDKLRGSDPGAGGNGEGTAKVTKDGGSDDMADEFKQMMGR